MSRPDPGMPRPDYDLSGAAHRGDLAGVERALRAGADPNMRNSRGRTPVLSALLGPASSIGGILRALRRAGADFDAAGDDGSTAVHIAASSQKMSRLDLVLEMGANPNPPPNKKGQTALHAAAAGGTLRSLCSLITAGCDLEARDKRGRTPLHFACYSARMDLARELAFAGARVDAGDGHGKTPAQLAPLPEGSVVAQLCRARDKGQYGSGRCDARRRQQDQRQDRRQDLRWDRRQRDAPYPRQPPPYSERPPWSQPQPQQPQSQSQQPQWQQPQQPQWQQPQPQWQQPQSQWQQPQSQQLQWQQPQSQWQQSQQLQPQQPQSQQPQWQQPQWQQWQRPQWSPAAGSPTAGSPQWSPSAGSPAAGSPQWSPARAGDSPDRRAAPRPNLPPLE